MAAALSEFNKGCRCFRNCCKLRKMSRMRKKRCRARWRGLAALGWVALAGCVATDPGTPVVTLPQYERPFNGMDLTGWRRPTGDWTAVASAEMDAEDRKKLRLSDGEGVLVNGRAGKTFNLLSAMEHRDVDVTVEFLLPEGSNSGVYLQGRYEVQIFDSWGNKDLTFADCGGIYEGDGSGGNGFEGQRPRVNASLPPGRWQRFDIVFRAPRFDEAGRKTENARFVKVTHNGVMIHEEVEATGPTRAAAFEDERPWGPLMLQGDHGPVAYRNLVVRHLNL